MTLANPKTGAWPDFHVYCRTISLTGKQAYRVSFRARSDKPRMMSPAMYDTTGGIVVRGKIRSVWNATKMTGMPGMGGAGMGGFPGGPGMAPPAEDEEEE